MYRRDAEGAEEGQNLILDRALQERRSPRARSVGSDPLTLTLSPKGERG